MWNLFHFLVLCFFYKKTQKILQRRLQFFISFGIILQSKFVTRREKERGDLQYLLSIWANVFFVQTNLKKAQDYSKIIRYNDQIDQMKNRRIIHSQLIVAHIYLPSLGASTESVWNTSRKGLIKDATVLSKNKLFFNLILLYFFILCLPIADTSALNDPPEWIKYKQ